MSAARCSKIFREYIDKAIAPAKKDTNAAALLKSKVLRSANELGERKGLRDSDMKTNIM